MLQIVIILFQYLYSIMNKKKRKYLETWDNLLIFVPKYSVKQ